MAMGMRGSGAPRKLPGGAKRQPAKTLGVTLPVSVATEVERLAELHERSVSYVIRQWVAAGLARAHERAAEKKAAQRAAVR